MINPPTWNEALDVLVREGSISEDRKEELLQAKTQNKTEHTPWFVRLLVGMGAWVAAGIFALFIAFTGFSDSVESTFVIGLILVFSTTGIIRIASNDFSVQLTMAGHITGQILSIYGISHVVENGFAAAFLACLLEITIFVLYPDTIMRFLTAVGSVAALYIMGMQSEVPWVIDIIVALVFIAGGFLWLAPTRWDLTRIGDYRLPAAYAFLLFGLSVLLRPIPDLERLLDPSTPLFSPITPMLGLSWIVVLLLRLRKRGLKMWSEPVCVIGMVWIILCACTLYDAGIIASIGVFALAFERKNKVLLGLASLLLIVFVIFFYYNLNVTLLDKSGILFSTGSLLLLLRLYFQMRWTPHTEVAS